MARSITGQHIHRNFKAIRPSTEGWVVKSMRNSVQKYANPKVEKFSELSNLSHNKYIFVATLGWAWISYENRISYENWLRELASLGEWIIQQNRCGIVGSPVCNRFYESGPIPRTGSTGRLFRTGLAVCDRSAGSTGSREPLTGLAISQEGAETKIHKWQPGASK